MSIPHQQFVTQPTSVVGAPVVSNSVAVTGLQPASLNATVLLPRQQGSVPPVMPGQYPSANGAQMVMPGSTIVANAGNTASRVAAVQQQPQHLPQSHQQHVVSSVVRAPGQATQTPIPVAQLSTQGRNIIINQPGVRPGTPGSQISVPLQTLQSLQPGQGIPTGQPGHLLVKTDDGQFQILRVSSTAAPGSSAVNAHAMTPKLASSPTQSRLISQGPGTAVTTSTVVGPAQVSFSSMLPSVPTTAVPSHSQPTPPMASTMPQSVLVNTGPVAKPSTTASSTASASSSSSQQQQQQPMTPEMARMKCKNFLATLLRLASEQPITVATNVRTLIQGLIDADVEPELFTTRLQNELNSSPQPCLGPFLRKSLPYLQQALRSGQVSIDGVRPPPASVKINMPTAASTTVQSAQKVTSSPSNAIAVHSVQANVTTKEDIAQSVKVTSHVPVVTPASVVTTSTPPKAVMSDNSDDRRSATPSTAFEARDGTEEGGASTNNDDEELNDVAAMGGVNLDEESQNMQGFMFGNIVGKTVRSWRDETPFPAGSIQQRISDYCAKRGVILPPESGDVGHLISLAAEQRVKSIVERLSIIAEHRMDSVMRLDSVADLNQYSRPADKIVGQASPYETAQDVRSQLRFMSDIDRIERRKNDEAERELLLRAAKSRTRNEDPDRERLKAKAKELQRIEEEQMRHEKANSTALLALSSVRKRTKIALAADDATASSLGGSGIVGGSATNSRSLSTAPSRIKRVNIRDVMFLMEQERNSPYRTNRLWTMYLPRD